jgi:hypothetical protein
VCEEACARTPLWRQQRIQQRPVVARRLWECGPTATAAPLTGPPDHAAAHCQHPSMGQRAAALAGQGFATLNAGGGWLVFCVTRRRSGVVLMRGGSRGNGAFIPSAVLTSH